MKYYIISGEASGDLHGSNLIKNILLLDNKAEIRCWGGDKMSAAGGVLVKHYKDLAFMGFVEVIRNLKTIMQNLSFCKKDIADFKPDVLVLIDYPGFNMRIAQWAHKSAIKIVYYISPQVWAWKEDRVKMLKKTVNEMLVILPFETSFYKKWNWEVKYVGHPLVEVIDDFKKNHQEIIRDSMLIAILPGSRKQEILKKLPVMLEVTKSLPNYRFVVAKAPGLPENFYNELLKDYPAVSWVEGKTYHLLMEAQAAMVTSGTATLETALFGVPQVICYKGNPISYHIAKRLVKIKYIGLVNLIMDKPIVEELIQDHLTVERILTALSPLLTETDKRKQILSYYDELTHLLTKGGNASANAAKSIVDIAG